MSNAGVALFSIAKESVVCVNVKIGDHVSPIGTAFLYKQCQAPSKTTPIRPANVHHPSDPAPYFV